MKPIVDPRHGDVEDDASSTKTNSLLSMAGSLLGEISLAKLIVAWLILFIVPAVVLGLAPLIASAWIAKLGAKIASPLLGLVPLAILTAVAALGWLFGTRLFRLAESSFWSLNALAIEPGYTMCREAIRHLAERLLPEGADARQRERFRSGAAAVSGLLISGAALLVLIATWPSSRFIGGVGDLLAPGQLAWVALANTVVVVSGYLAVAALVWGLADATMEPPRDFQRFHPHTSGARTWRIAHLSDLHVVGERYGFRIESGRSGPRGDARLRRVLARLEELDASAPLDAVLISGDATDAGRSIQWAEFLDALAAHPTIAERVLMLPGNHDVNIVDRANPARLDLSIGPNSRLRKIRTLSAINTVQGSRVRVVNHQEKRIGATLADALQPHAAVLSSFAERGRPYLSTVATDRWDDVFPLVLSPDREDGLGIILLNSKLRTSTSPSPMRSGSSRQRRQKPSTSSLRSTREPAGSSGFTTIRSSILARQRFCRSASERPSLTATGSCAACGRWRSDVSSCTAIGTSTGSANAAVSSSCRRRLRSWRRRTISTHISTFTLWRSEATDASDCWCPNASTFPEIVRAKTVPSIWLTMDLLSDAPVDKQPVSGNVDVLKDA